MAKNFDLRKQLKLHDNSLLKRLFHGKAPMAGVDWGSLHAHDIEPIAAAWDDLEDEQKKHYQVILQDVNELADPRGHKVLFEELEWRHPNKLEVFGQLKSPADKALWAYFEARGAFDQAAIFARAEALRNGQYSNRWNSLPKEPLEVTEEKINSLAHEVRSYYWQREMRGQVCKVHHYRRHDGAEYFFAYLPDWPDKQLIFDADHNLAPGEVNYAFSNVFVFEPKHGSVELIAKGGKKVQLQLRQAFCKSLLGLNVDDDEPIKPIYQLDQILDPSFAFTTDPADRIAEVRLRRIRLVPKFRIPAIETVEPRFRESATVQEIRAAINKILAMFGLGADQVAVTQIGIQLVFRSDGHHKSKKMTFNVSCPNTCDLKTKPDEYQIIGERCLIRWEVLCG